MSRSLSDRRGSRRDRRNRKGGPSCGCWHCDEGRTKRRIIGDRIAKRETDDARGRPRSAP